MKANDTNQNRQPAETRTSFKSACLASCKKILAQMAAVRAAIYAEANLTLGAPRRLLRLALNEAEAAAWLTRYPHLVFPELAMEKVQALAAWNAHQQSVRRTSPVFALTA